tara:strand:- start:467 stop:964 length:498 start_codon:yes stop_codon:yes gene_type:complete
MNFFLFLSSIFVLNANAFFPFPNSLLSKGIVNIDSTISNIDNKLPVNSIVEDVSSNEMLNKISEDNLIEKKYSLWEHFDKLNHDKELGIKIVKHISSFLPKVDTIGHKVLHANNEFINDILNLGDYIPHETKKSIILLSIKMAQMGDDFGSHLLQVYYDLVDKCL